MPRHLLGKNPASACPPPQQISQTTPPESATAHTHRAGPNQSLEQLNELHVQRFGRMSSEPRVLIKNSAHRPILPSPKAAYYAPCLGFACEAVHQ